MWSKPDVLGDLPPPVAFFTLTKVDGGYLILYGGSIEKGKTNSNVYLLDLLKWVRQAAI